SFFRNGVGLAVAGAPPRVFHNNIFNNGVGVRSLAALEVSDTASGSSTLQQGNWWGHACPGSLFIAGTDSNSTAVVDSYPYAARDAWQMGVNPGCSASAVVITSPVDGALLKESRPRDSRHR